MDSKEKKRPLEKTKKEVINEEKVLTKHDIIETQKLLKLMMASHKSG